MPPRRVVSFCALLCGMSWATELPVIDLGYELYRASKLNETTGIYNFLDIRYGAPPIGDLRWKAPQPPAINRWTIQEHKKSRICTQGSPLWALSNSLWSPQYLSDGSLPDEAPTVPFVLARDPRETEDCLFLDVFVPQKAFENRREECAAPVVVWIHGGGFSAGSKASSGDFDNLLKRSIMNSEDGIIVVSINYRLGTLGWLSGSDDVLPNAGLYDQRLALQWVRDNIHHFGGNRNHITVMGESAGGGSIMHHITVQGGQTLFQKAIVQSPAWFPYLSIGGQEKALQHFLTAANVSSIDEARMLPSDTLMAANAQAIKSTPTGMLIYGPVIDNKLVHADPKQRLRGSPTNRPLNLIISHNSEEGIGFLPLITNNTAYVQWLEAVMPAANASTIDFIAATLYPPVFNGSFGYSDQIQRAALTAAEAYINCNANALSRAYANRTYGYIFAVSPGLHGQDTAYTFYNPGVRSSKTDPGTGRGTNSTVAYILQDWITTFSASDKPKSSLAGLSDYPTYGAEASIVQLTAEGVTFEEDTAANDRCNWWQLGLYL